MKNCIFAVRTFSIEWERQKERSFQWAMKEGVNRCSLFDESQFRSLLCRGKDSRGKGAGIWSNAFFSCLALWRFRKTSWDSLPGISLPRTSLWAFTREGNCILHTHNYHLSSPAKLFLDIMRHPSEAFVTTSYKHCQSILSIHPSVFLIIFFVFLDWKLLISYRVINYIH